MFAGAALHEAGSTPVEVDLALVPGLHEAVVGPARGTRSTVGSADVDGPVLAATAWPARPSLVVRLLGEVHLDAGLVLERLEVLPEVVAGPAHEVDLARRGQHPRADDRRRRDRPGQDGATLEQGPAGDAAARIRQTRVCRHYLTPLASFGAALVAASGVNRPRSCSAKQATARGPCLACRLIPLVRTNARGPRAPIAHSATSSSLGSIAEEYLWPKHLGTR